MKARWLMKCECCSRPIEVGSHYVMFHGRPWLPAHVTRYRNSRVVVAK